jgi:hypothetical protein
MFRRKFLTAALVAVAAWLTAPAVADAGFKVEVRIDGELVDTINGTYRPATGLWTASGENDYAVAGGFVTVEFRAQSNNPGSAAGAWVFDTTTNLINSGSGAHRITISAIGDEFGAPGAAGDELSLTNRITSLGGTGITGPNADNLDVYGLVDPDSNPGTNNEVRTDARSYSPRVVNGFTIYETPFERFTRGANYDLTNVIDLTLGSDRSGQITTQATVVTPAPSGLILAATALPFLIGLRRRLRTVPVTA